MIDAILFSFAAGDTFALGELSAYIEACANNGAFDSEVLNNVITCESV